MTTLLRKDWTRISGVEWAGLGLLAIVFFVWPTGGWYTLKDLMLLVMLALFAWLSRRQGVFRAATAELRAPLLLLGGITAWLMVSTPFLAIDPAWSWREIGGQWFRPLIMGVIGFMAAAHFADRPGTQRLIIYLLLGVTLVHLAVVDVQAVRGIWLATRQEMHSSLPRFAGLTDGTARISMLTNIAFALVLTELYFQRHARTAVPRPRYTVIAAVIVVVLVSIVASRTRNAVLVLALMLLAWVAIQFPVRTWWRRRVWRYGLVAGVLVLLASALYLAGNLRPEVNTRRTIDTVVMAWDTGSHRHWLNDKKYPMPSLPDGQPIDISAYQRVAWFKEGLVLVGEHPFGIGFGRIALVKGLEAKYGESQRGIFTHSGVLDFAIGAGVPAALMWVVFVWLLLRLAWRRFRDHESYAALALFFVVLDFGSRMFIDHILREQMFQQFMLLAGVLAGIVVSERGHAVSPLANTVASATPRSAC